MSWASRYTALASERQLIVALMQPDAPDPRAAWPELRAAHFYGELTRASFHLLRDGPKAPALLQFLLRERGWGGNLEGFLTDLELLTPATSSAELECHAYRVRYCALRRQLRDRAQSLLGLLDREPPWDSRFQRALEALSDVTR